MEYERGYIPTAKEMKQLRIMQKKKEIENIGLILFGILISSMGVTGFMQETVHQNQFSMYMMLIVFFGIGLFLICKSFKNWIFYKNLNLNNENFCEGVIYDTERHWSHSGGRKGYHRMKFYATFKTSGGWVLDKIEIPRNLYGKEGTRIVILCQGTKPMLYTMKEYVYKEVRRRVEECDFSEL